MLRTLQRKTGNPGLARPVRRRSDQNKWRFFELESLEGRLVLSGLSTPIAAAISNSVPVAIPAVIASPAGGTGSYVGTTPQTLTNAYRVNTGSFSGVFGDGAGQTIAIVDAFNDPNLANDVLQFDIAENLPGFTLARVSQTGSQTSFPANAPLPTAQAPSTWGIETSLDVEWAHVMAPRANILLVETNSDSFPDLYAGVNEAKNFPGVAVVSMSWGIFEDQEAAYPTIKNESLFTTPSGHTNVTFLAATGDSGAFDYHPPITQTNPNGSPILAIQYPAASANVVAVGGTTLNLSNGNYSSETAWSGSGGGFSSNIPTPSYQSAVNQSVSRATPDVSMVGDPNTGVGVYDSYDYGATTPWVQIGGTSLATPLWAGVIAIADQGRTLYGSPTLDGPTQTLPALYNLSTSDLHDVTSGNNGYWTAGTGYDPVTGRGTPIVASVVRDLTGSDLNAKTFVGILSSNQAVFSPNGKYYLEMQGDGNLVDYGPNSSVLWASGTAGHAGAYAWMQSDGNLVIYSSTGSVLWYTSTQGNNNAYLSELNNGTTEINQAGTNAFLWTGNTYAGVGRTIAPGEDLFTINGTYRAEMQTDGNFVQYGPTGQMIWQSRTGGNPGAHALMQTDGNLVISQYGGPGLWSSATYGEGNSQLFLQSNGILTINQLSSGYLTWTTFALLPNQALTSNQEITTQDGQYTLLMQSDGNLVESGLNGQYVWSTGTFGNPGAYVRMQGDGNLVVYSAAGAVLWYSGTQNHPGALLIMEPGGATDIIYNNTVIFSRG